MRVKGWVSIALNCTLRLYWGTNLDHSFLCNLATKEAMASRKQSHTTI